MAANDFEGPSISKDFKTETAKSSQKCKFYKNIISLIIINTN